MNYPAAPIGGIAASLGQTAGYQAEIFIAPRGWELNLYPPPEGLSRLAGLSTSGGLKTQFIDYQYSNLIWVSILFFNNLR